MANAEGRGDSEERNEEGSRPGLRVNFMDLLRERSWLSSLERSHSFVDPISLHLSGRNVGGSHQVLICTFPPVCLVCLMIVRICVIQQSQDRLRHQPVLLASLGPRLQSDPPQYPRRPSQQPSAERDSGDSIESEEDIQAISSQIAMQIFSTVVGNVGHLRRRCVWVGAKLGLSCASSLSHAAAQRRWKGISNEE